MTRALIDRLPWLGQPRPRISPRRRSGRAKEGGRLAFPPHCHAEEGVFKAEQTPGPSSFVPLLICTSWPGARLGRGEATAQAKEAMWGASQAAPRAGRLSAPASVNGAEQGLSEVAQVPRPRPPAPQALLPSSSSSEKQCPGGGRNPRQEARQNQSLELTFSQPPSAPSSLSGNRATFC